MSNKALTLTVVANMIQIMEKLVTLAAYKKFIEMGRLMLFAPGKHENAIMTQRII